MAGTHSYPPKLYYLPRCIGVTSSWMTTSPLWCGRWALHGTWPRRRSEKHRNGRNAIGQHDKHTKNADFCMPATKTGPLRKLARPFKGPYRVVVLHPNGADLHLIEKPRSEPIRVALNRLRRCPTEVAGDHAPELHSLATTSMGSPVQMTTQNTRDPQEGTTVVSHQLSGALDCVRGRIVRGRTQLRPGRCREHCSVLRNIV